MLDDRKAAILRAVVEEYVATGSPVGSAAVGKTAGLSVSSATVRNEMMVLEAQGYITHPHTSAGRVPTDLGYRYYVDHLTARPRLTAPDRTAITHLFSRARQELEEMLAESSRLLSRLTAYAAVVVGPQWHATVVRDVHFVSLSATTVLAVVVSSAGRVDKFILETQGVDDEDLRAASKALCETLRNRSPFEAVTVPVTGRPGADALAVNLLEELGNRSIEEAAGRFYLEGTANLVAGSVDPAELQHALAVLEQQTTVLSMLSDALDAAQLVVRIGSENAVPEMRDWSVVTASYKSGGRPLGAIGVVGPTRMNYARTMSAVEAVSAALGAAFGLLEAE